MALAYQLSKALSILLFLYYGSACLFSEAMVAEFERFGLARWRRLTGGLEVLGALGLLTGYFIPILEVAAAAGLSLLMILGVATRIRVRDTVVEMLPALVLMLLNLFILIYAIHAGSLAGGQSGT